MLPPEKDGGYWMELWTHILEEYALRHTGLPGDLNKRISIPDLESNTAAKACELVRRLKLEDGKFLFKYGESNRLVPAYSTGIIRINPASSYSDPSLNKAIGDRELEFNFQYPPSEFRMEVFDRHTGKSKGTIEPIDGRLTKSWKSDFYVYCASYTFNPRLFLDFNYDACLIIDNPRRFLDELTAEFEKQIPGFVGIDALVKYCDPLNTPMKGVSIDFCKHFRYAYQKEVRISWIPNGGGIKKLNHVEIALNLKKCSTLVTFDTV